jgi:hypothetical protein
MLHNEMTVVCSQIHTKHVNKFCGQKVDIGTLNLAVHKLTTASKGF